MPGSKPTLIVVQSTDSPIREHLLKGIWDRQKFTLSQYAKEFNVYYYTCDDENHQDKMPAGVTHKNATVAAKKFGLRHILYYCFLLLSSFKWRKINNAVVRIVGVNVPAVPLLKLISRKKFIISYQFDWAYGMKKDYKGVKPMVSTFVQSRVINTADHLICTTAWLSQIARDRYHFDASQISIIPNYVNVALFKPSAEKTKQIAFAGRLHWSKGIDTLIKAFKKFATVNPDYKLIIMGIGEEEQNLKQLSGRASNIIFTGGVSNNHVASVLNDSEIFVLPTVNMEGHPKALVEAMAAGCKCITSDVPGNNNVLIESNSQDYLFPSQNAEILCEKLLYAVGRTDDRQIKYALNNYSDAICFGRELKVLKLFCT
jgi:glycosyltransferase involved in cell wall biosynthesis